MVLDVTPLRRHYIKARLCDRARVNTVSSRVLSLLFFSPFVQVGGRRRGLDLSFSLLYGVGYSYE